MSDAIYQDIPRVYTALTEWGACMVYLLFMQKRVKGVRFWGVAALVLAAQTAFLCVTEKLPVSFWIPCMAGAVCIMYLFLRFCQEGNQYCSVYYTAKAFLLAEFTASLGWQIVMYFKVTGGSLQWITFLSLIMISVVVFTVVTFAEKKSFSEEYIQQLTWREVLLAAGIVTIIFAFSNFSFIYTNSPFSGKTKADIFNIRTLTDLIGILALFLIQQRISKYLTEKEMNAVQGALRSQYQQYRGMQDSLEIINIKYHDLKHQIAGLRAETDGEKRKEWLDTMEQGLDIYQSFRHTGNAVLDTILASKLHQCKKNDIKMTCVIDGDLLSMLHVTDICTIFGNALDNAIESTCLVPESEKRLIHLSVSSFRGFLLIKVENYCETAFDTAKGKLPKTTKSDTANHGYGMKSVRYSAEHYGGSMNWKAEQNWFELIVLIPQKGELKS